MNYRFTTALILALSLVTTSVFAEEQDIPQPTPVRFEQKPGSIPPQRPLLTKELEDGKNLIAPKRVEFRQEVKEDRMELQEKRKEQIGTAKESRAALEQQIKERREALKAEIQKIKKERVSNRKAFVETHFQNAIDRLTALIGRLQAKIDDLEDEHDLSDAQTALDDASKALAAAKTAFSELKTVTVSDTDEASATKPREIAKRIETSLKEARAAITKTLSAIKEAVSPESTD